MKTETMAAGRIQAGDSVVERDGALHVVTKAEVKGGRVVLTFERFGILPVQPLTLAPLQEIAVLPKQGPRERGDLCPVCEKRTVFARSCASDSEPVMYCTGPACDFSCMESEYADETKKAAA